VTSLLTWLEQSALGHLMRESGPWMYPAINLAHIIGVALLFGSVLTIDLALLGVGRQRSAAALAAIADAAGPVAATGFLLAACSGIGLLASNGSEYAGNPFFLVKFPAIALGLVNAILVNRSAAWRALRNGAATGADARRLSVMAVVSIVCWTLAIGAGRMIGYW
jgi:uncharacterized membrane protein YcfT